MRVVGLMERSAATRNEADEHLVRSMIALADDHRANCHDGSGCTITLSSLAILLDRAGIKLTPDEVGRFL